MDSPKSKESEATGGLGVGRGREAGGSGREHFGPRSAGKRPAVVAALPVF